VRQIDSQFVFDASSDDIQLPSIWEMIEFAKHPCPISLCHGYNYFKLHFVGLGNALQCEFVDPNEPGTTTLTYFNVLISDHFRWVGSKVCREVQCWSNFAQPALGAYIFG
jgi:hypothetical protein